MASIGLIVSVRENGGEPERFQALADASEGDADYVEDCPVCCRPIAMHQHVDEAGRPSLLVDRAD
jgi:hypothetical protein